jgi:hypothetical protein
MRSRWNSCCSRSFEASKNSTRERKPAQSVVIIREKGSTRSREGGDAKEELDRNEKSVGQQKLLNNLTPADDSGSDREAQAGGGGGGKVELLG